MIKLFNKDLVFHLGRVRYSERYRLSARLRSARYCGSHSYHLCRDRQLTK
jgi:hypothetical protein